MPDGGGYYHWLKVVDGHASWTDEYATRDTVDDAVEFLRAAREPWFLTLSLNAPHKPYDPPPGGLVKGKRAVPRDEEAIYREMLSAADAELGRLIRSMPVEVLQQTLIVFLTDNGTPAKSSGVSEDEVDAKGTLGERGIRVPLLVVGPGVTPGVSDALVHVTDVFSTIVAQAGVAPPPEVDGVDLSPLFSDPSLPGRPTLVASLFGSGVDEDAVRDDTYKLVRSASSEQLYRPDDQAVLDGPELLADGASPEEQAALERLRSALDEVLIRPRLVEHSR